MSQEDKTHNPEHSSITELRGSNAPIAQAIVVMGDRIHKMDSAVKEIQKEVTGHGDLVTEMQKLVKRLNFFVAGDPELQAVGLLQREKSTDERITRLDDRCAKALEEAKIALNAKLEALTRDHWAVKNHIRSLKIWGASVITCITVIWAVAGDEIKAKIFARTPTATTPAHTSIPRTP